MHFFGAAIITLLTGFFINRFTEGQTKFILFAALLFSILFYIFLRLNSRQKKWYGFSLIVFFGLLYWGINSSVFQTWIVQKVANKLSKNLHTKVSIRHVDFQLFDKMLLEGALVLDKKNDTLLYAGTAKVNITDWFFFKDSISLKYVGLDDAIINLKRKDSVWNYQFLVDYFGGSKKKDTSKSALNLDLKIVELKRVKIWKQDEWAGQNMLTALNAMELHTDDFNTNRHIIKINTLTLDHPVFSQYNYPGLRPPYTPSKDSVFGLKVIAPGLQWNKDEWIFVIKDLEIKDGNFAIEKASDRLPLNDRFDGQHIVLSALNGSFKNVHIEKDTITANINLSTKDRSGFEIKKLSAAFKFTPQLMEFKNLDLITNRSHFKDYYAMRYKNFNTDMGDFMHAVKLEANLKQSEISSDDLAFFSPQSKTWKTNFSIAGNVSGTIDDIAAKKMIIKAGKENYLDGDISLRGLPDINETYINLHSNDLRTSYNQISNLIPKLRTITSPDLSTLGNIRYTGNFTGFINDFVLFGIFNTNLGTIAADMNMKFGTKGITSYSGLISTNSFDAGRFIHNDNLGNISFAGKIAGNGADANAIGISVDGNIKQVFFNGYNYQNIIAKGTLKKKVFEGLVSIDDPNIKVDGLVGNVNFSGKSPQFNFEASVAKLNLKNLKITNDDISLTGIFNLNFTGNNIDDFLGSAKLYNATLRDGDQKLSFDSLNINSTFAEGKKYLSIVTNELEANLAGNFKVLELQDAFQLFLNRYYPAYIKAPKKNLHDQNFSFNIKTKNIGDYIALFNKKLKGFDNSDISGDINLASNILNINVNTPSFAYNAINFNNVKFTGKGTFDSLSLAGNVGDVIINDSLHLPDTKILVTAHNDISDISIKTTASKTLNEADLSLQLQTLTDGFKLYFNPSSFVINNKKWTLEKGGELVLSKKLLSASEVKFVQDKQELIISTEPSGTGNSNDVVIDLKKINIGDIAPFVLKTPRLEGLLTGNIRITDPFKNLNAEFDTRIDEFRFENDSVGILKASGSYSSATGDLLAKAISDNLAYNFNADFAYKTKDSTNNQLKGTLNLNHSNIHILEKYLSTIFNNIQGNATGILMVSGLAKDAKLTGSIKLNDATLTVNYTRCRYIFENNSVLTFNKDEIDFGKLKIRDTLNNTASISGKLYHSFFTNFFFSDLEFKTNNPGKFVLLNTTLRDNKQFYGNVIGQAELSLNGPINDMRMFISGEPTDSSHIYLPTGETAESGKINYIEFIKFGREMQADLSTRQEANIKVDMALIANPFVKIDVILDETTKDIIKAQGSGRLNISAGTKDPLTIRGRYDVEQGQYTFNFQTFLKKPFTLQQGYIEWQGDPYLANLNVDAIYKAENVSMTGIPTVSGSSNATGDVDIIFKLRGTLKEPKPDFEFQLPFGNSLKSDPIANEYFKTRLQSDRNELNRQVTSLLLFNSFIPQQDGLLTASNTSSFVFRSVGQILSATLSSSLNNWLQKLLKTDNVNLYTKINTSDFSFNGINSKPYQNIGNIGLKTSFFKNKLLVTVGGNIDYQLAQASSNTNSNLLFTPDVTFEYLLTPDGRFRVVGFNRTDAGSLGDIAGVTRHNRTGILLSYRKDFDTFGEFFVGSRKRKQASTN